MSEKKSITIRDVPEPVHRELAARAARTGRSLQEYLLAELERVAAKPTAADLVQSLRLRKNATRTRLRASRIVEHLDADRQ